MYAVTYTMLCITAHCIYSEKYTTYILRRRSPLRAFMLGAEKPGRLLPCSQAATTAPMPGCVSAIVPVRCMYSYIQYLAVRAAKGTQVAHGTRCSAGGEWMLTFLIRGWGLDKESITPHSPRVQVLGPRPSTPVGGKHCHESLHGVRTGVPHLPPPDWHMPALGVVRVV